MNFISRTKWWMRRYLIDHYPQIIIQHEWPGVTGHRIDWNAPRDINEKIQWLMCFSDTTEWTRLSDKYLVREYVKARGLGSILTKQYGVWNDARNIDFDLLPNKFVLKCNHDSGSTVILDKTQDIDFEGIVHYLNNRLKQKFGYVNCEPHYNTIKPLVIAEEFIESKDEETAFSTSLIDYKVWCFNGTPHSIWTCYSRNEGHTFVNEYDLMWNLHEECSVFNNHYRNGKGLVPKPRTLDQMRDAARVLSEGFPEVRVDFYEADGRLIFGEMTFSSLGGRMDFYTEDYLKQLGDMIILPSKK